MNTEDRDYLDLIGARGDPDADKRWLISHLEAEAREVKQADKAAAAWMKLQKETEVRAETLEAECRQAKALLQYVLDCDMAEQDWDACRLQDFLTPGPAQCICYNEATSRNCPIHGENPAPRRRGAAMTVHEVIAAVEAEMLHARDKHAPIRGPHEGYAVILEELEELWAEVKRQAPDRARMKKEALHVAAMGARFVLDLCQDSGQQPQGGTEEKEEAK